MFTSITNRSKFGATYEWAVLSVLPMVADKDRHGLRVSEVNQALGMPKEARTTATLLLKRMAAEGMIRRYEYKVGKRPFITCLLYTSPSPRDLSTSRMPSSA